MSISTVASGINNLTIPGDGVLRYVDTLGRTIVDSSVFGITPYQLTQFLVSVDVNIPGSTKLNITMTLTNADNNLRPAIAHGAFYETTVADANAIQPDGASVAGTYDTFQYNNYNEVSVNGYEASCTFTLYYYDASPNRDIKFRGNWLVMNGLGAVSTVA